MAGLKVEKKKIELNLTTVKQLSHQITSFGLENAGDPLFQWRLVETADNLKATSKSSDLFPINNSNFTGQLNLTLSHDRHFKLSLNILDKKKQDELKNTFNRFQLFLCQFLLLFRSGTEVSDECLFAMRVFNLNADKHGFAFHFPHCFKATAMTVELYQEPLAFIEYRSPYQNMVVGKVEKVREMMEKTTSYKGFLFVSPRFDFGSHDQLMMVRFSSTKYPVMATLIGLTANLHIFSQSGAARGAPFSFAATFVIISQTEEVKGCINKVFCRRDENKSHFNTLLLFSHELEPYLENGTLYYKVHIESQLFE